MSLTSPTRIAILANGDRVPLERAAFFLSLLDAYLHGHEAEWDPVVLLRELSLGRDILPEQARSLEGEGLLEPDGTLDPVLRSVVLSAVRGEGVALRLDPPFTDPLDRTLAELLAAQEYIRSHLPPAEADVVLQGPDPLIQILRSLPTPPSWTARERGRRPETPPGPPLTP